MWYDLVAAPLDHTAMASPTTLCELAAVATVRLHLDAQVVQLSTRKGFCKHALRTGAPLLPVYIFGQTQLFYTFSVWQPCASCAACVRQAHFKQAHARAALLNIARTFCSVLLCGQGKLQELLRTASRALRISLIPFVGRSWLSPFVPLESPLTCVVGLPLNMDAEPIDEPTQAQVDELHSSFCVELRRLFETHKVHHPGFEHKRLYFDDEDLHEEEIASIRGRRRLEEFHLFPSKI